jgi:hypothetical protein
MKIPIDVLKFIINKMGKNIEEFGNWAAIDPDSLANHYAYLIKENFEDLNDVLKELL